MANEVGLELEEPAQPAPDRTKGAFAKFFDDPKNIATALIFGASLAMPRQEGHNGLSTLLQRATGAAAFRGALESGIQGKQLQREQTAFERAQAEREAQQRDRQIVVAEQGVGLQQTELAMQQSQFERGLMADEENARLNRDLERQLAGIKNAPSEADLIDIAMKAVPSLLETMQFEEGMTPEQRMVAAQHQALKGVLLFRSMLDSGAKIVTGPGGELFVDDGKGNQIAGTQVVTAQNAAPGNAPTQNAPSATSRVQEMDRRSQNSVFAPTIGERAERASAGAQAMREQVTASSQHAARNNAIRAAALRTKRQMELGGTGFRRDDIAVLKDATDEELQKFGLTPQMIIGIRRLATME